LLNAITSNTNGDLIITGNVTSEEQRFMLTKYFVQVLAGITNSQVVLDPEGKLYIGSKDVIPFKVSDADVYVDAILLCPIPKFIEFMLQTPGGDIISPSRRSPTCNGSTAAGAVLPHGASSHRRFRIWKPRRYLACDTAPERRKRAQALLRNKGLAATAVSPSVNKYLPYSFLVHATSNLRMDAWKVQNNTAPGSVIGINATLKAYDVPFSKSASVWAEMTLPDGSSQMLKLNHTGDGRYAADYVTSLAGVYVVRVMAERTNRSGSTWTREKTLTAGVYRDHSSNDGNGGDTGDSCRRLSEWLRCLLGEHKRAE